MRTVLYPVPLRKRGVSSAHMFRRVRRIRRQEGKRVSGGVGVTGKRRIESRMPIGVRAAQRYALTSWPSNTAAYRSGGAVGASCLGPCMHPALRK